MRSACLVLGVVMMAAACGGASSGGYGAAPAASAAPASSGALQIVDSAKLGKVLAAGNGMTLYLNQGDPNAATCTGSCAQSWPPFIVSGTPTTPSGLGGTLALMTRADGMKQVTYNGLPLYFFTGDQRSGDANGDGLKDAGGTWSAVKIGAPTGGAGTTSGPTPAGAGATATPDYGY